MVTAVPIPNLYDTVSKEFSYAVRLCLYFSKNQVRNYPFMAKGQGETVRSQI